MKSNFRMVFVSSKPEIAKGSENSRSGVYN